MGKLFLPLKAKQKKEYYFSCIFCPDAHQIPMLHNLYMPHKGRGACGKSWNVNIRVS